MKQPRCHRQKTMDRKNGRHLKVTTLWVWRAVEWQSYIEQLILYFFLSIQFIFLSLHNCPLPLKPPLQNKIKWNLREEEKKNQSCHGNCSVTQWVTQQTPLSLLFHTSIHCKQSLVWLAALVSAISLTLGPHWDSLGTSQCNPESWRFCSPGSTGLIPYPSRPQFGWLLGWANI